MTWLDNDLSIFYLPGSGGFFLLFLLLLEDKHFVKFDSKSLIEPTEFFNLYPEEKFNYKLTEEQYILFKGSAWPDYRFYMNNFESLSDVIKKDILRFTKYNLSLEKSAMWKKYQIRKFAGMQFNPDKVEYWKLGETWPDNQETQRLNLPAGYSHKLYFHCNDYESWINSPGLKIALYSDIKSQIRMCWHKHAGLFADHLDLRNKKTISEMYRSAITYNNTKINYRTKPALDSADKIISLADLVDGTFVQKELSSNRDQLTLHKKWVEANTKFKLLRNKNAQ